MATPARPMITLGLALLVAVIAPGASDLAGEPGNLGRLRAMPLERRVALAENLERFDRLDPAEQAAIRKLDAAISAKDPVEQARLRALLRRYHLWVAGLGEEQKRQLEAATDPAERFALARKFRLAENAQRSGRGQRIAGIRTGDFGLIGPIEAAHLLRIWQKLPDASKAEIGRREGNKLRAELRAQAHAAGVRWEPFPKADDEAYFGRLEGDPDFKPFLGQLARRSEAAPKKAGHPIAEFLYFEDHPARAVDPRNFERFVASCPEWLLAMLDPLSADDSRHYLRILYRRIYPHPAEMPEATADRPKAGPAARPTKAAPPRPQAPMIPG